MISWTVNMLAGMSASSVTHDRDGVICSPVGCDNAILAALIGGDGSVVGAMHQLIT
jgi:hypothetical protein